MTVLTMQQVESVAHVNIKVHIGINHMSN